MFITHELSAAPHFPCALRPLITAMTAGTFAITVRVNRANDLADVEITESDGEVCITINPDVIDG
ncbi:hypothetical protein [Hyphomicrobium sp.]|uniref:hypothetical protein n=1 Tax=Hyphomicrobium sp. TaxID=82 RepID=UPI002C3FA683|nr:hypothetical protein [Hyphomicrobium sp.]HVZ03184.1 hypothetical protein [Hyphomicrobium sp.]